MWFILNKFKRFFKPSKFVIIQSLGCHGHENNQEFKIFQPKQKQNKLTFKSKSWKKIDKNMTSAKYKSNKILLQEKKPKQNKVMTRNKSKNGVEQTKGSAKF